MLFEKYPKLFPTEYTQMRGTHSVLHEMKLHSNAMLVPQKLQLKEHIFTLKKRVSFKKVLHIRKVSGSMQVSKLRVTKTRHNLMHQSGGYIFTLQKKGPSKVLHIWKTSRSRSQCKSLNEESKNLPQPNAPKRGNLEEY